MNINKNKLIKIKEENIKKSNLLNKYLNDINNSKKIIKQYEIVINKNETINEINNNKISELQKENENLKQVIQDNNISNKNQISQILEERIIISILFLFQI